MTRLSAGAKRFTAERQIWAKLPRRGGALLLEAGQDAAQPSSQCVQHSRGYCQVEIPAIVPMKALRQTGHASLQKALSPRLGGLVRGRVDLAPMPGSFS